MKLISVPCCPVLNLVPASENVRKGACLRRGAPLAAPGLSAAVPYRDGDRLSVLSVLFPLHSLQSLPESSSDGQGSFPARGGCRKNQ